MNGIVRCPYCGKEYVHQNCVNILCPCGAKYYSHNSQWLSRKPKTNADRIRAMSDEELAWELMTWRIETCARLNGAESPYPHTQKSILDWLQQPVKDGNNE